MPTFTYASKNLFALIISCFLLMVIGPTAQSQPDLQVEATADPSTVCTQGAVELNAEATGGTGDYDYSWVGNPGNFTSSIQNPTVFPDVSTTTDITYTVVVNDGVNTAQDAVVVHVIANPEADAGADASMCETDNSYFLNGEATDNDYTEWTTAGDGSFGSTGSLQTPYEPGEQDQQNGSVQITLHAFATPPCTGFDSDQMTLTIIPKPTVDAGENQNICENEIVQLAGNASDYSQVTWSGGDGDFGDPNSLQTIYTPGENDTSNGYVELTLTADPEEPCTEAVTDQLEVDITNLPIAEAGPDDTICEGNTYTPFQANAQYYSTVSWTSDGDGEFENPNSLNPVYNPGSNDIESGEVMLTLTASGQQACDEEVSDAMTLTINYAPEVDAGEDASICESDTYQLQPTVQYSNEVQWSTSGDGTFINDTTENAVYDPGEEDIANDSVELTITAQPIAPCEEPASDEMTLSFEPSPIVSAGENGEVCDNGAYQLDGDTIFSESVYWSSDGEGTFDDSTQLNATYFPVEEDGQNGEVTLTLSATPVSPCSDTIQDSMQLDILPSPFVYAGSDNTICETGTFEPNNADVEDADTYYWSTTGDGNFIDDDTLNTLTPEYIPGEQDIAEDSVYLVLTGENDNCSDNQDSLLLTIQGDPMADAGEDTSKCVPEGVTPQFTLNGSVENSDYYVWSVEGGNSTGSFDSTVNILDPVFSFGPQGMENQSATLTLTANAISPCPTPDSDEVELSFSWQPTVDAGVDTVICEGADSIQLDGDVSHESTLIWQRIPDTLNSGNFGSQVVEDPVYYPSSADFEAGEIKLMLQAFGAGDCNQIEARDTVIYNVQKLPVADAGEDTTICEDEMAEISDAEAQHYGSVQWDALNGSGSFSDENSLTTTYNPSSGDLAKDSIALKLSAWAVTPCEAPDSDTLILSINKNPTI
ncbi:MAG: hypothetical protein K9I74_03760, partial [Bacteroidales bacterium]|nr:hypothetical protein [Bacteroidales bacterium]